jgi:peptide-methionine (S)-S-oxide reductase
MISSMFPNPLDALVRRALDAIDAGDVATLERLLVEHPELVHKRLTRPGKWLKDQMGGKVPPVMKDPYLLWFVSEDIPRKGTLPANIVDVTRAIIDAAKRERVASLEEQVQFTLRLVAWSGVAAQCGVQVPLIDLLIEAGATAGSEADNALVNGHLEAAAHLIDRGGILSLGTALCLDRWGDIPRLFSAADEKERRFAFVLAALNGKAESLGRMIALGADVNAPSRNLYAHGTPLHHAVCSGSSEAVQVLVEAGAGVNTRDTAWKGTPLGWAHHYIEETKDTERRQRYETVARYLVEQGARDD